jgi:hypothetical protein
MNAESIYVDASRTAVLDHGVWTVDCRTLEEAVSTFERLPKERQEIAVITSLGATYTAAEIKRFRYNPKPSVSA